ncbi:MAG: glycosyltransferase family 4 protein [Lachnospiraceae bacterium]|nr:glycosyltransferase family 4 protein [Lachnospiraceae bacterium]
MKVKTLTFFSNYFNHHQKALCDAWFSLLGDGFTFVETMPMESFRANMGWGESDPPYLLRTYESAEAEEKARTLALQSDLVVMGTAPEYYLAGRLKQNRIVFRYSERPLKEGFIKFFIPRLTVKYLRLHVKNRRKPIYVLGASAFTSLDFHKMFGSYENKCYKFGYFPEHIPYEADELMRDKEEKAAGVPTILWMGRMLKLKHPELVVRALGMLRREGYDFRLHMAGEGEMRAETERLAKECGIGDVTTFSDFYKPRAARDVMAQSMIYVMTSDKLEGWGSVIYEAQNAGCAQIASHACGATPWLVSDGETGLVFESGNVTDLAGRLRTLLDHPELVRTYGMNALKQMQDAWNPETAAERVLELFSYIEERLSAMTEQEKRACNYAVEGSPFTDGPCSTAPFLKNNWIRSIR